eukprot:GEZU01013656.1.p1 GENE.GEZU01013656.1~~GEZU01013656.1.p1  ORF type:complete len:172 (-),score=42.39 GEZU01013656.1:278-793(-)
MTQGTSSTTTITSNYARREDPFKTSRTESSNSRFVNILFGILTLIAGCLTVAMAVYRIVDAFLNIGSGFSFTTVIVSLYLIFFGIAIAILAVVYPPCLSSWLGFYRFWLGRGFFLVFLGCLFIDINTATIGRLSNWIPLALTALLGILGISNIILHFASGIAQPRPFFGKE